MTGHQNGTASVASRWSAGGGAGEGGEAVDEGRGPDVEVVGPAVMQQVPDHLRAGRRGGGEHRASSSTKSWRPARGSIRCQRSPSRMVRDAEAGKLAVVGLGVGVMAGAGDQVEPPAGAAGGGSSIPSRPG